MRIGGKALMQALGIYYLVDNAIGCIVAAIVVPIAVVGLIVFIGGSMWWNARENAARDIARTNKAIQAGADHIREEMSRENRVLHDDEGDRLLRSRSCYDAWQNYVRYERISDSRFRVLSYGPDQARHTEDDVVDVYEFTPRE